MPKPNYGFAKRQKELAKKQKKEEKRQKKIGAAGGPPEETSIQPSAMTSQPPDRPLAARRSI